jgi:hypothetical protein
MPDYNGGEAWVKDLGGNIIRVAKLAEAQAGGSMSVTDGTTTVDPATSLHLPAGTLTDLGSGEGGVGLLVRLIGPYPVTYASVGKASTAGEPAVFGDAFVYVPLAPLPDGALVITAWAEPVTSFVLASSVIYVTAQPTDDPDNSCDIASWKVSNEYGMAGVLAAAFSQEPITQLGIIRCITGCQLACYLSTSEGPASVGAANIYAIIATPAVA